MVSAATCADARAATRSATSTASSSRSSGRSARASAHVAADTIDVALASSPRSLDLRVGPLRAGGGRALVVEAAVPGVGNVIEQLSDALDVKTEGEQEFLLVRLAYAGSD
jgi:serine/threonine-protein kinase RsbW